MHDAGPLCGVHEVAGQHPEGLGAVGEEVEQRDVAAAHQFGAADRSDVAGLRELGVVSGHPVGGQHVVDAALLHHCVGDVTAHRQHQVRRQRPRCGGPGQHPHRPRVAGCRHQVEGHGDGRILAGPGGIVEADLEVRQWRLRAPRVGHHPVRLVHQSLAVKLGEGPHDRLHVGQVHGLVVVAEVDPAGLAGDRVLPLLRVADNGLAAALVELGYAEFLDRGPAGHPQLALGLHLGRQPVAVPPEAPVHPVAPHGLVPGHDILDVAGEEVAVVGEPVGERRAVVEDPVPLGGPRRHRLLEGPLGLPASQDPALDGRKIGAADLGIRLAATSSHGRSGYRRSLGLFVPAGTCSFRPAGPVVESGDRHGLRPIRRSPDSPPPPGLAVAPIAPLPVYAAPAWILTAIAACST